ncbi:MAG: hypothetical protein IPM29_00390 [Planctomycetes bacterium]|nr:hypothetical protein [Planctomycetota bacterium]
MRYDDRSTGGGEHTDDADETGHRTGVGVEARCYPEQSLDGFYVGAGVFPPTSWDCQDGGYEESGDETAFAVDGSAGYIWMLGDKFSLRPTAIGGSYHTDFPESGAFAGLGVRFGLGS